MSYRTRIDDLDNDSLLQIFSCYRLGEEYDWTLRYEHLLDPPQYSMASRTHIHYPDNDTLPEMLSCYWPEKDDCNVRVTWRKFAHVCRRWRYLIFDSWSHLDMRLLLTNDPLLSLDTLSHLPPLPLVTESLSPWIELGPCNNTDSESTRQGIRKIAGAGERAT
jgi:hypothetical protein